MMDPRREWIGRNVPDMIAPRPAERRFDPGAPPIGRSDSGAERRAPSPAFTHTVVPGALPLPDSLLARVAAGDAAAVDEVVTRYGGLVFSLCRRFLSDAAEAEDASQEIFVDLWRSAPRFDASISSEANFVATIARRRLIDRGRRKSRDPGALELPADVIAAATEASSRAEISDEAAIAAQALSEIREEQRQVLVLAVYHGLTHEQIAEVTRMPLGTVKTHARRGLIRIREIIEEKRRRLPATAEAGGR